MVSRYAILCFGVLILTACASGSPAPDSSPTASVGAVGGTVECPSVRLLGPGGTAPDLDGTWFGIGEHNALPWPGTYELNLLNSCVAWIGRSAEEGEEVGARWTNVFLGKLNPNLTISGEWAVVSTSQAFCGGAATGGARCDRARGTLLIEIQWPDSADTSRVRLVLLEDTTIGGRASGVGDFVTGTWVRPGDEDLFEVLAD